MQIRTVFSNGKKVYIKFTGSKFVPLKRSDNNNHTEIICSNQSNFEYEKLVDEILYSQFSCSDAP